MITVVIPDLHHHTDWVDDTLFKLWENIKFDEVVFLGDYFDDFGDGPDKASKTARWLKERFNNKRKWKEVFLIGNHDFPYMLETWNDAYFCPGFNSIKDHVINQILTREDWKNLKPAYYTQGFLMSHAGFSYNLVAHPILGVPTPEELVKQAEDGLEEALKGNTNKFYIAGYRMATGLEGGIIWSDWNDEYIPIAGIPQVVGHTPGSYVRSKRVTKEQTDYCVDCGSAALLIITDGKAEVKRVKEIK